MTISQRSVAHLRRQFVEIYESCVVGGGFFESDQYYRNERERYWRSLELLCQTMPAAPTRILEIGGGQLALLCKKLFHDDCTVADISERYKLPIRQADIAFMTLDLVDPTPSKVGQEFDVILLLEVIEHIPLPGYVVLNRITRFLKPGGIIFITTPNLFRIRNLIRMFLGVEFIDRFMLPEPGQSLGHQLEYSADHLRWQLQRADMEILMLEHDSLGRTGHSAKARLARRLLAPLEIRPLWRDGLVAVARKPATSS
jgi:2-polyprenyl-3-methyl-5-hydroxy-6-metoxy-1,4-benzoquinol methylase